jgi:dissimilatory sulfite reductase (desulfoviridin) alpha/beta subunit
MTLKEKFDVISCKDCDMPFCEIKCTMLSEYELNKLEKIADDYAIEFAEWILQNEDKFVSIEYNTAEEAIKGLLEIFKKEKEL